jgi:hypothetical protein
MTYLWGMKKSKTYDVINCYCNGFVMLPFEKVVAGLSLDQAQKYVSSEERLTYMGETRWMIAPSGSYKLKKIKV